MEEIKNIGHIHECRKNFTTEKIDRCSGIGHNRCYGDDNLKLELWYAAQDGTECYYDGWIEENVNYCPYCGYSPKNV